MKSVAQRILLSSFVYHSKLLLQENLFIFLNFWDAELTSG